jgi:hypothetical protein
MLALNYLGGFLDLASFASIKAILGVYIVWILWRQRTTELVPEFIEQEPPGKQGLIVPLSPINPFGGMDESELKALISRLHDDDPTPPTDDDFAALERSNLGSPMQAIEYHYTKGTLRDCWLITT